MWYYNPAQTLKTLRSGSESQLPYSPLYVHLPVCDANGSMSHTDLLQTNGENGISIA
jgi:hypothetical protein